LRRAATGPGHAAGGSEEADCEEAKASGRRCAPGRAAADHHRLGARGRSTPVPVPGPAAASIPAASNGAGGRYQLSLADTVVRSFLRRTRGQCTSSGRSGRYPPKFPYEERRKSAFRLSSGTNLVTVPATPATMLERAAPALIDPFGRAISYLRVSV